MLVDRGSTAHGSSGATLTSPEKRGILDLYARTWEGDPLVTDDFVIRVDEKTSIQARLHKHPSTPPRARQSMRVEHEYARGGAWAYLAALDVHRAKLFGRCDVTTGIAPFDQMVTQVTTQSPYRGARRVFWIVDNRSSQERRGLRRASPNGVPQSSRGPRSDSYALAEPNRKLLLDRPTEGVDSQRISGRYRVSRSVFGVPELLQEHRHA